MALKPPPRKHLKKNEAAKKVRQKAGTAVTSEKIQAIAASISLTSDGGYFDNYDAFKNAHQVKEFDATKQAVFLLALLRTNSIARAAATAGVARVTVYKHLHKNQAFYEMVEDIKQANIDSLEEAAFLRARDGVAEPVYQGGVLVGYKQKYSDSLAQYFLDAMRYKKSETDVPPPGAGEEDPKDAGSVALSAKRKLFDALSRRAETKAEEDDE